MKGFMHLIEVAVAGILIMIILGLFFTTEEVKLNWERPDLISTSSNVLNAITASGKLPGIFSDSAATLADIENLTPANIEYGIRVYGTPPNDVKIGCASSCSDIRSMLSKGSYVNGRWIKFSVEEVDMSTDDLVIYDAVMFKDYSNYGAYESKINNYIRDGGTVIAIENVSASPSDAFKNIFGLSSSAGSSSYSNFTSYNPTDNKISKYFLGFGFLAEGTSDLGSGTKQGQLDIWDKRITFNLTSTYIKINGQTAQEGGNFTLTAPDSSSINFRVKKIFFSASPYPIVAIQPMGDDFVFNNTLNTKYVGNKAIVGVHNSASCTVNGTAIWIQEFKDVGEAQDYRTLVKAAAATSSDDWYLKDVRSDRERAGSSVFLPMCCDMPETAQIEMISW